MRRHLVAAVVLACPAAFAQTVSMSGSLGDKALLMIDGAPRTVATGATVQGVKLVSVTGNDAVVEIKGKRVNVVMGGAQVSLGGQASAGGGSQIVLTAGSGGHFMTAGAINGRAVRFMVDTGATSVSMSIAEAEHIGLDYRKGQRGFVSTANGNAPAYKVRLGEVRVGDVVVYDVEATVLPAQMEFILLGNSFLTRFQMKRENETMTLSKRF
ncbi:MAG: TIGR02281 family clan AA aspartic protease [Burkholderiaceae bacterium]